MNSYDPRSPNFGKIIVYRNVQLPNELLIWPYLEITVKDKEKKNLNNLKNLFNKGCEECYTTLSLIPYAMDMGVSARDIRYA